MKHYERIDATITTKDKKQIYYNVLEMCVKTDASEIINSEKDLIDIFYEIVDAETREKWNYSRIDIVRTWGNDILTATIYG